MLSPNILISQAVLFFVLCLLTTVQCQSVSNNSQKSDNNAEPPAISESFVTVNNGNFQLENDKFYFVGTNAYYLPNYEKINPDLVDETLDIFEESGVSVIRIWGFYEGNPQYQNDISLQPQPGIYNEAGLRYLDNMIAKAKSRNIRLVIALANYWQELGGMPQYNTWDGNPDGGMAHFISDTDTQDWFKMYIHMLLNRVNTVTKIAYKNEPAIVSWEIMNEARLPNGDPQTLRDWYREIAQFIKQQDSNHLVSTGEEGFEDSVMEEHYSVSEYSNTYVLRAELGTSYLLNTQIPEIDYGTAHWYPQSWGFGNNASENLLKAQRAWLSDHVQIATQTGKPFVLGEYGFTGWGSDRVNSVYKQLWNHAEEIKLNGSLLWQLTIDGTKCYEFGGNICYPGGRRDATMYKNFTSHTSAMNQLK